jgi:hypothetical protein
MLFRIGIDDRTDPIESLAPIRGTNNEESGPSSVFDRSSFRPPAKIDPEIDHFRPGGKRNEPAQFLGVSRRADQDAPGHPE